MASADAGRFAPSPSGRMHLGNLFAALISWLAARSRGARWILRIEDLDPDRSRPEYARLIDEDLQWLGLDWDEGGLADRGPHAPYSQSRRHGLYKAALTRLADAGLIYHCICTRREIMATQAPHQSDGTVVYSGRCRPAQKPPFPHPDLAERKALRLFVSDEEIRFRDLVFGPQCFNLARDSGDFLLRRADGAWAYQLAVVVDDALMGVGEVVRGCDLLSSAARQIYLHRLLGFEPPRFAHLPLLCAPDGRRLSKRDLAESAESLRAKFTPRELCGRLAMLAGLQPDDAPARPADLVGKFDFSLIPRSPIVI